MLFFSHGNPEMFKSFFPLTRKNKESIQCYCNVDFVKEPEITELMI